MSIHNCPLPLCVSQLVINWYPLKKKKTKPNALRTSLSWLHIDYTLLYHNCSAYEYYNLAQLP